jgi:hypothetical protein
MNSGYQSVNTSIKNHFTESKYLLISSMFMVVFLATLYMSNTACTSEQKNKTGCMMNTLMMWASLLIAVIAMIVTFFVGK